MDASHRHSTSTDQRTLIGETHRRDACPAGEQQLGVLVERRLCRVKECGRETESNRPAHNNEVEIEQIADRRCSDADQATSALHDLVRRLSRWAAGDCLNCQARRFRLQAPARATLAATTIRFNHDVTDVTGISAGAIEQLPIQHHTTTYAGADNHRQKVLLAHRGAEPTLAERERLRIKFAVHR